MEFANAIKPTMLNFDVDENSNDSDIGSEEYDSGISSGDSFCLEDDTGSCDLLEFTGNLSAIPNNETDICYTPLSSISNRRKRRRSTPDYCCTQPKRTKETTICDVVMTGSTDENLVGDKSRPFSLPTISGKHKDLKSISPDTMVRLLKDEFSEIVDTVTIVDCRYPYEYEGGHIKNAINLWNESDLKNYFINKKHESTAAENGRDIVIFHCEFSSKRGPNLTRYLRQIDRELNADNYPALHYPEIYLLEGGYKAFYHEAQDLCVPQTYKPMDHPDHVQQLKRYRTKSRTHKRGRNKGLRHIVDYEY